MDYIAVYLARSAENGRRAQVRGNLGIQLKTDLFKCEVLKCGTKRKPLQTKINILQGYRPLTALIKKERNFEQRKRMHMDTMTSRHASPVLFLVHE